MTYADPELQVKPLFIIIALAIFSNDENKNHELREPEMINQRFLTQQDAACLARLAEENLRLRDVVFNRAEDLVCLLSAAVLLPDNVDPTGYVGLNSMVAYRIVGEEEIRSATILFALDKKDSFLTNWVITPFALALIGIRAFDIVATPLSDGRTEMVEVLGVNSMHRVAA